MEKKEKGEIDKEKKVESKIGDSNGNKDVPYPQKRTMTQGWKSFASVTHYISNIFLFFLSYARVTATAAFKEISRSEQKKKYKKAKKKRKMADDAKAELVVLAWHRAQEAE